MVYGIVIRFLSLSVRICCDKVSVGESAEGSFRMMSVC